MPATPAEPKVLRSFALVASPVGEVVGAGGEEGAAKADPMGGDDGSLADAGVGGFQPAAWTPAGGVEAKGVSFRWSVFDVFIKRLGCFDFFGCKRCWFLSASSAGGEAGFEFGGELALVFVDVGEDPVLRGAVATEERGVRVRGHSDVVKATVESKGVEEGAEGVGVRQDVGFKRPNVGGVFEAGLVPGGGLKSGDS